MAEYTQESYDALVVAFGEAQKKHSEAQLQIGVLTDGDTNVWHDNFSFDESNRQEQMLRREVAKLRKLVSEAVVVEKADSHDLVQMGAHVVVRMDDEDETFVLAGEQNFARQSPDGCTLLSQKAPLGSALMGRSIGDKVTYMLPSGIEQEAEIIKIW